MGNPGLQPGRYRHFKGGQYRLIALATHSETGEQMVVYQALYGERGLWVRPAAMWQELLERDGVLRPRFEYLGPWEEDGEQPDSPQAEAQA